MNAVVHVEECVIRPPTIGKIRPGIKMLTRAHQSNEKAVKLYHDMVAAGESFEAIGKVLETSLKIHNALVPKNVPGEFNRSTQSPTFRPVFPPDS